MFWIWVQSSTFNPSSFEGMHSKIGIPVFLFLGAILEIGHLFEFAILYFLLIIAFLTFGNLNIQKEIGAFLIAFLYGVLDEIHQYYVPFRSTSTFDLVKNTIGIIVISYIIHRSYYKNIYSKLGGLLRRIPDNPRRKKPNIPL
ncbi:VanZ family protein [Fredinandcohnia sp. 179-A 10B2 NHS]|uniref:VanZ family protein n=1 Tax=Fredinandcohnia sp. 179-A 10B2 NHS TaxID=3235176 RepID=UPI0039A20200